MNEFEVFNETEEDIDLKDVEALLNFALLEEKVSNVVFNVIFTTGEKVHKLNKEYRGIDRETDVISFALEDNEKIKMPIRVLGDIYISVPKIKEQAKEYGHSERRECLFLVVHGLLHLLGYDHMTRKKKK